MDGRKEKRTPRTLRVLLSSGTQPVVAEYASTENVSSYVIRVRTDRPWKKDACVMIKSTLGEPWARQSRVLQDAESPYFRGGTRASDTHRRLADACMTPQDTP